MRNLRSGERALVRPAVRRSPIVARGGDTGLAAMAPDYTITLPSRTRTGALGHGKFVLQVVTQVGGRENRDRDCNVGRNRQSASTGDRWALLNLQGKSGPPGRIGCYESTPIADFDPEMQFKALMVLSGHRLVTEMQGRGRQSFWSYAGSRKPSVRCA